MTEADPPGWYVEMLPRSLDGHGDVAPPWARCPEIPYGSIGWRMGYGESWLMLWWRWLEDQPTDRDWRAQYLRRHPKAPCGWVHSAAMVLTPGIGRDAVDADVIAALHAEGFVGRDVAQGAWEARHHPQPEAPWERSGSVGDAARYGGRELTFWARWCARERDAGRIAAWLSSVPEATGPWEPLRQAVTTGMAPEDPAPRDEWERLSRLVAASGWPPPPWTLGHEPASLNEDYDDDATYADAWSAWVSDAIDDDAMWSAYLERYGPIPPEWARPVAREVWFGE